MEEGGACSSWRREKLVVYDGGRSLQFLLCRREEFVHWWYERCF